MKKIKLEFIDDYTNPGFKVGDVLYWDEDIIPVNLQPRPYIGKVTNIGYFGITLVYNGKSGEQIYYYFFNQICESTCLYED